MPKDILRPPSVPMRRSANRVGSARVSGPTDRSNNRTSSVSTVSSRDSLGPKENINRPARVSVQERDYLEQDAPIRGQEFVCISFLSPEDEIQNKEVFTFGEFTKNFSRDIDTLLKNIQEHYVDPVNAGMYVGEEKETNNITANINDTMRAIRERYDYLFDVKALEQQYKYFKMLQNERLTKEYSEKNDFRTNVRGIKVRGVYGSIEEAKARAAYLKKMDPKSPDIYVGQVGCWCPWSPYPEEIADQEYTETDLNTLMKKYKENEQEKDEHFIQRKQEMQQKIENEKKIALENKKEETEQTSADKLFEEDDPWIKAQKEKDEKDEVPTNETQA